MEYSLSLPPDHIALEPLTQEAFAEFGQVIENPNASLGKDKGLPSNASVANQGTAIKYANVSPVDNKYYLAPSKAPARPSMTMFVCQPRQLRLAEGQNATYPTKLVRDTLRGHHHQAQHSYIDIPVIERHPYSSQTFIPIGLEKTSSAAAFVVVVVPTQNPTTERKAEIPDLSTRRSVPVKSSCRLSSSLAADGIGLPDLENARAFLAKGNQAVTYGAGTWHAPMAVIGLEKVEFVVVQNINQVPQEDCQEILIGHLSGQGHMSVSVSKLAKGKSAHLRSRL